MPECCLAEADYAPLQCRMRILLVKTSSMGDVIHNLPVASDIRTRYPDASIDWAVEEAFAAIPALHPAIDRVIRAPAKPHPAIGPAND